MHVEDYETKVVTQRGAKEAAQNKGEYIMAKKKSRKKAKKVVSKKAKKAAKKENENKESPPPVEFPAMLVATAETVGLTQKQITACKDVEALKAAITELAPPVEFPAKLVKRAKKIGMSPEMIAVYPDAESLKRACDGISPRTNPDARVKEGKISPPVKYTDKMPDKFEFESAMEEKFISASRAQFDENNLQLELRKINRKHGPQKPVRITKDMNCNAVKGKNKDKQMAKMLITKFVIFMK